MRSQFLRDQGAGSEAGRRGSVANIGITLNPLHAKFKGIVSTPGFCKFSAWKRESDLPRLPFSTWLLGCIAAQPPAKTWLKDISTGRSITFGEVRGHVERIAKGLVGLGVAEGDTVCLWASNLVEYWLVGLAAWEVGAALMPTNCLIQLDKLVGQLRQTKTVLLVCDELNAEEALLVKARVETLSHILLLGEEGPAELTIIATLMQDKADTPHKGAGGGRRTPSWDRSPIYLAWTSRGEEQLVVQHTSKSLLAQMFNPPGTSNHWFDQVQGDTVLGGCWFFHMTGLYSFALSAVHGISLHILSDYSDELLLSGLAEAAISTAVLYPWQLRMLVQSPAVDNFQLNHLKVVITGGNILGPTLKAELFEKLPSIKYVREAYGLKETGLLTYTYPRDKAKLIMSKVEVADDHLMPLGFPNMWTVFKVVDRVTGEPVSGPDIQGELCVKTPQLMLGLKGWEGPHTDPEGFFHTGDLGFYDRDGIIHFMEQISNLIGFWMYEVAPSVLESRLLSHYSVVDAAVVGIPDKVNGQIPRGFVVLKPGHEETEENLTNYLESRLQDHERLRGGLHYIQHIPRDENWKVMRSILEKFIPPAKPDGEMGGPMTPSLLVDLPPLPSPRSKRAAEAAAALLNPGAAAALLNIEPQDRFGMRSRSRRGSQDNLLQSGEAGRTEDSGPDEDEDGLHHTKADDSHHLRVQAMEQAEERLWRKGDLEEREEQEEDGAGKKIQKSVRSRVQKQQQTPGGKKIGGSKQAQRPAEDAERTDDGYGMDLCYKVDVTVNSSYLESKLLEHPEVKQVVVRGVEVEGVGMVPRAYVVAVAGSELTAEALAAWTAARLDWQHRLVGGLVLVDGLKDLPSDSDVAVNLDTPQDLYSTI